jgi:hypothetical protein
MAAPLHLNRSTIAASFHFNRSTIALQSLRASISIALQSDCNRCELPLQSLYNRIAIAASFHFIQIALQSHFNSCELPLQSLYNRISIAASFHFNRATVALQSLRALISIDLKLRSHLRNLVREHVAVVVVRGHSETTAFRMELWVEFGLVIVADKCAKELHPHQSSG